MTQKIASNPQIVTLPDGFRAEAVPEAVDRQVLRLSKVLSQSAECLLNRILRPTDKDQEAEAPQYQDPLGLRYDSFAAVGGRPGFLGPRQRLCSAAKPTSDANTLIVFRPLQGRQPTRFGVPNGHKLKRYAHVGTARAVTPPTESSDDPTPCNPTLYSPGLRRLVKQPRTASGIRTVY
jgi:hypothetical protein